MESLVVFPKPSLFLTRFAVKNREGLEKKLKNKEQNGKKRNFEPRKARKMQKTEEYAGENASGPKNAFKDTPQKSISISWRKCDKPKLKKMTV